AHVVARGPPSGVLHLFSSPPLTARGTTGPTRPRAVSDCRERHGHRSTTCADSLADARRPRTRAQRDLWTSLCTTMWKGGPGLCTAGGQPSPQLWISPVQDNTMVSDLHRRPPQPAED